MTQHLAHDGTSTPVASSPIPWPPLTGPGSDKEAWVALAREVAKGNEEAWNVVDEQAALIARLEAEVVQLQAQLAERSRTEPEPAASEPTERAAPEPKGSRRKTSEATREAIRTDLAAGLSQKEVAARYGVSVMTVWRLVQST
jgi:predicted DNA-binding protein (UPF0251 family)